MICPIMITLARVMISTLDDRFITHRNNRPPTFEFGDLCVTIDKLKNKSLKNKKKMKSIWTLLIYIVLSEKDWGRHPNDDLMDDM